MQILNYHYKYRKIRIFVVTLVIAGFILFPLAHFMGGSGVFALETGLKKTAQNAGLTNQETLAQTYW